MRPQSAGGMVSPRLAGGKKQSLEAVEQMLSAMTVPKGEKMVLWLQKQQQPLHKRVFVFDSGDEHIRQALLERGVNSRGVVVDRAARGNDGGRCRIGGG